MCGILGQLGFQLDRVAFQRALDAIAHRGPDDQGLFAHSVGNQEALFGHRRLAIIDLSPGGAQPMRSHDGRHTIVFNGEIYNYLELRRSLEQEGVVFRSHSDTEVLLEAFVRRGPAIFAGLNGMFALAIYDHATGDLVFARDHLGVKPFYYALEGDRFTFGSEIKSMLALGVRPKLNRPLLGEYLAQMWIQEPDTLFEGVAKLPAGHWGRFRDRRLEISAFWDLTPERFGTAPDDPLARLEALVTDAVKLQLVADRPVGAYISGGVDSSVITHLAAQHVPDLIAVSARLSGSDLAYEGMPDDGVWADRFAADHPGLRHHKLEFSQDLYDQYKALIWHLDEPIADSAIVPAFLLAQRARDAGAVVMLSGMGGDELFGGYSRYSAVQTLELADALPGMATSALLAVATSMQRFASGPIRRKASHAQRFFQSAKDGWPVSYVNLIGQFSPDEIDALAGSCWRTPWAAKMDGVLRGFEGQSRLVQAQRLDLKGFLASHNLIYSDKASMAASVEVRVPLLDYRMAELAFALPDALRASRGEEKVLLKKLCAGMVGADYAYRQKAGFAMPIRSWLRDALRPEVERAVREGRIAALFDRSAMTRILEDHYGGRRENTWKLWTLLNLDLWLERFDVAT